MTRSPWTTALVLAFAALAPALAAPRGSTSRAPSDAFDLSTPRKAGEALLIESTTDAKIVGTLDLAPVRGQKVKKLDSSQKLERRLVDEFTKVDGDWAATRFVAAWHSTADGNANDPELDGAELHLSLQGGEGHVDVANGRRVAPSTAAKLLSQVRSAGLALDLPAAMAVGDKTDHGIEPLLPFLLDLDGKLESATTELTLAAVDPKTQVATLTGHCATKETITDPVDGTGEYSLDLTIEVDLANHRVATVAAKGSGKLAGHKLLAELNATVEFSVKVKATAGDAAAKARAEKPKFRDVERAIAESGISCKLPSHFFESTGPEGAAPRTLRLLSTLADDQVVLVTFLVVPVKGTMADGMKTIEDAVVKQNPGFKPKDVRSGLGKGRGSSIEKEGELVDLEWYPAGDVQILRLTVAGKPDARKALAQELTKMRASLRSKAK